MFSSLHRVRHAVGRVPPMAADGAMVLVLIVLAIYEYTHTMDDGHRAGPDLLNVPLTIAELLPLAWRRRNPLVSFVLGYGVVIVPSLIRAHTMFAYSGQFPLAIYLYSVARHCPGRTSRWALLGPPVAMASYALHVPQVRDVSDLIFAVIIFSLSWLLGVGFRRQATQKAALADALDQLSRQQRERERLAVLDERARLARDLHDVVAHAVALVIIQAGVARVAMDDDPALAREALLAVDHAGREATGDLRRLLNLLRAEDEDELLLPVPGLSRLPGLVTQMSAAGLDIELEVVGEPRELAASMSVTAFRVLQEALTNVLKHAGPTQVRVRLVYGDPLEIEVVDSGPRSGRPPAVPGGHGLLGMRQRVALFDGLVHASRQDNGFAVRVEIPQHVG